MSDDEVRAGVVDKDADWSCVFQEIQPLLKQVVRRIDVLSRCTDASRITGIPTGFTDLDRMTSGLQPGELVIVASRPSMGKTAFVLNIVEHVALVEMMPAVIFSMQMSASQLAMRMLGSLGRLDQHKMRTGVLNDAEWKQLTETTEQLSKAAIFIDDSGILNATELCSRAHWAQRRCGGPGLGLIVLDDLQLIEGGNITRSLKALAQELNVPVIALTGLTRAIEERSNKRPVMPDLRGSKVIEQDTDLILFIYRDEVYEPDSPDRGKAEIIIGKHRNGPTGNVILTFLGQYSHFENYRWPYGR